MDRLYGGCIGAYRVVDGQYRHYYTPATGVYPNDIMAKNAFLLCARETYPVTQGYYGHYATVVNCS